jgi:hypothetical protein
VRESFPTPKQLRRWSKAAYLTQRQIAEPLKVTAAHALPEIHSELA